MRSRGGRPATVSVRLIGPPEADGEYVELLGVDGSQEIVHLHDYDRLYATAGLYEHIVHELLGCTSPRVVAEGLASVVECDGLDPARVRLLDLGAGTGLVGELVYTRGIADVFGLDTLESARVACLRDRPGVYSSYLVGDPAQPSEQLLARLEALRPTALTAAGAFGGKHAPPAALGLALRLLPTGAPAVFTIDQRWTSEDGPGGFRTPLTQLIASGTLDVLERSRFQHRVSTTGRPVLYELFVGRRGG
jgi:hypothetical protein